MILEKLLFYLLIFCLPFQVRKTIYQWGDGFNEWTSVYFYLTDLLLISILLLWFWRKRKERFLKQGISLDIKNPSFWLVIFLIISFISLSQASNIQLGFYRWFKLLEMAGLFFYLRSNFRQIAHALVASGLFQSVIALGQYFTQKSLGLRFLWESPLAIETAGVAKIIVGPLKIIRAYGTFSHPNLLAVFLLFCLFCVYFLWLRKQHSFIGYAWLIFVFGLLFSALALTYSRLIIIVFLLASLIYFIISFKQAKKKVFALFLLLIVFCSLFIFSAGPEMAARFSISLAEQSVTLRNLYNQTSFLMIKENPWLGIGLGNFVWQFRQMFNLFASWLHQPVHNIYLLLASEVGLIGLVVFLLFIWRLIGQVKGWLLIIIFSFLIIGLFDHFFLTLQQGQLLFWLVLGLTLLNRRV